MTKPVTFIMYMVDKTTKYTHPHITRISGKGTDSMSPYYLSLPSGYAILRNSGALTEMSFSMI
jgi:hypothetical protein